MLGSKFVPENTAAVAAEQHQQQQQQQQHHHHHQHQQQQQQHHQQQQQLSPESKSFSVSEENRHYLKVFIQTYRNLPILWDTTLRDYSNRDKRAEAYEQLVPIYRFLKRDANLLDVKKKINTLRTNYRKELKMIEMARKQGTVYHPRCWTYYDLDFLRNAEKFLAVDPNHNIKTEPTNSSPSPFAMFNESTHQGNFLEISPYGFRMNNGATPPPSITQMFQKSFGPTNNGTLQPKAQTTAPSLQTPPLHHVPEVVQNQGHNETVLYDQQGHTPPPSHNPATTISVANHNKRMKPSSHANQTTSLPACICSASNYGEEEALTRTWAYKLKRLSREQRLYAEKFINDILFEAETGTLHRGSMQLNAFEPYVRFEETQAEDETSNASHDKSQSPHMMTSNSPNTAHIPVHSSNSHSQSHDVGDVKNIEVQDKQCAPNGIENENSRNASFHNYN